MRCEGAVNMEAFQAWISPLIRDRGQDIFRSKGRLSIAGREEKFVFQGVHMIVQGGFAEKWEEGEA
eukprot:gene9863-22200_t